MTWTKLCDGFLDHPKVLRAGEDAANLYIRACVWCNKHLTDGAIPREALRAITSRRDVNALAARLVDARLWEQTADGWQVHDWADHNPTRDEVEGRRTKTREKVAAWREGRRKTDENETCNPVTNPVTNRLVTHAVTDPVTLPPSRPVPARPDLLPSVGGVQGNREGVTATADASAGPDASAPPSEDSAKRASRRPRQPSAPAAPETAPLPGTDARRVYDAVAADRALGARLRSPAAWSERVTAGAFPALGVHGIVREIARAGAWVADQPPSKAPRDAGAFLRNWLARADRDADRDAASDPRAVACASEPRRVRLPPPPPPAPPPPPPSTPEQRAATDALLTRLRDEAQRRVEESRRRITVIEPVGADRDDDLEDDHD